ncbi:MAG: hypothetical protein SGARI_007616, partial [Bacillariaceae sp.]
MVTNSIKLYVGYLRPIFYDQCQPNEDYTACTASDNTDERQLRLSFPSGHASMAVCGMLLFSKFLEQRFGMYKDFYQQYYSKQQQQRSSDDADVEVAYSSNEQSTRQRQSPRSFRFGRIVSLLCYSPMAVALFV